MISIKLKLTTYRSDGGSIDSTIYEADSIGELNTDIKTFEDVWELGEKWEVRVLTHEGFAIVDNSTKLGGL